ncbi:DUF1508 domain-containing protein [Amycolatopsis sp. CA-230715]|uniref:DUF1508 domain-containing protein n=1 Tax=Amycolatopsis sp. CA-230715 TaxID=2745196 RepID=UPI001C039B83|nr:DUF1508 domain-containing protein [Amycolatopsis sp. CA-230715]QWF83402.1 hypothetical protein HUW46_06842 [Amycolatopsis sp. CA-230715]
MTKTPRFQLIGAANDKVRWRLLGGNNASLGTGAGSYRGPQECLTAIQWLKENLAKTRAEFSHASGGKWRWLLYADAELLAMASHAYGRKIEAKHGLERFLAATPGAVVLTGSASIADWRTKYKVDSPEAPLR